MTVLSLVKWVEIRSCHGVDRENFRIRIIRLLEARRGLIAAVPASKHVLRMSHVAVGLGELPFHVAVRFEWSGTPTCLGWKDGVLDPLARKS